jgi:lipopolysaccharide assembly outer membrane protein LptD (OstA)
MTQPRAGDIAAGKSLIATTANDGLQEPVPPPMSRNASLPRKHNARHVLCLAMLLLGFWWSYALAAAFGSGDTANKNAPMTFQADEVQYDDQLALTVAKGHVEISQGTQILLADVVTYNQHTDTVTASGHVSLMMPDGTVLFSNYMELRNGMNDAFADNVRMLMADRSRLAANAARRTNGNRLELRRAVYSPCDLCKDDPSAPPAWQLKAREMTDDQDLKRLEFATQRWRSTAGRCSTRHTCRRPIPRRSAPADS